jgi:hypothetical protein
MSSEAERMMQMLDDTAPRPRLSQSLRFSALASMALAALPPWHGIGPGRRVGGGHAYQQIMESPVSSMRIDRPKKNVNRPPGARRRKNRN